LRAYLDGRITGTWLASYGLFVRAGTMEATPSMRPSELEALIVSRQLRQQELQSILSDPSTPPDVRADCLIALARLVTEMQALVIELKDGETIQ